MSRLFWGLIVALVAGFPVSVEADALYFEFRPDYNQSLLIASQPQPVEQIFLPLNDHISGFDFWLSNNAVAGNLTVQLYNPSGTLIATRVASLPAIPDQASGTRTNISLPAQVPTSAHQPYVVRLTSTLPSLRLYHAQQQQLLAHNATPQLAYTNGLARIGGSEREFAFTYALYEDNELTVPVITSVTSEVLSVESVVLRFNATEPVDASVIYSTTGQDSQVVDYSGTYTSCPTGLQPCSVFLPITTSGVEHSFVLTVRDVWGNTSQATGTFTSAGVALSPTPDESVPPTPTQTPAPTPDTVPPVISNTRAIDVTHESVGIAWSTDEAANSLVVIQFGSDKITAGGNSDSALELEHYLTVPNLGPLTPYTARVQSADAFGNDTSVEFQFSTLPVPTPNPNGSPTPSPSGTPSPTPTVSVGPTGDGSDEQTVTWSPPGEGAPNGYRVDVIGEDGKLIKTIYTFDTSADLGALPDGARVIVYSDRGDGVYEKVTAPASVSRSKPLQERIVTALPYIVGGLGVVLIGAGLIWRYMTTQKRPEDELPDTPTSTSPFTSTR